MNVNSEQLDYLGNVILAQDQPLTPRQLRDKTISYLGAANCYEETIAGKTPTLCLRSVYSYLHGTSIYVII